MEVAQNSVSCIFVFPFLLLGIRLTSLFLRTDRLKYDEVSQVVSSTLLTVGSTVPFFFNSTVSVPKLQVFSKVQIFFVLITLFETNKLPYCQQTNIQI